MHGRASCPFIPLVASLVGLAIVGCNLLTGAENIVLRSKHDDDDSQAGSGGGGLAAGGGAAQGGSIGGGPVGGGGPTTDLAPADGVFLDEIAIFQGVKRPLMQGGSPASSSVPVVANRDALLRVYYHTDGSYNGAPVWARLTIGAGPPIDQALNLAGPSSEQSLSSTVNFDLAGALLPLGAAYSVQILQDAATVSGLNAAAQFPATGQETLATESSGPKVRLTLVPIQYNADGSGRVPDTGPGTVEAFRQGFFGRYPAPEVEVNVHSVMPWNSAVSAWGDGWDSLLTAVADLHSSVPAQQYLFGLFEPASSLGAFCGGGCVAGLGFVPDPSDVWGRTAIGLGFDTGLAVETALHEIGHTHGRYHAPCGGPDGVDPYYPYSGGKIGSWGYDLVANKLYSPTAYVDMMTYCSPTWLSDYTFSGLFDRIKFVNGAKIIVPEELINRHYDRVLVAANGSLSWLPSIQLEQPPMAESVPVEVLRNGVVETVDGQLYRFSDLPGGVLFVTQTAPIQALSVSLDGAVHSIGP